MAMEKRTRPSLVVLLVGIAGWASAERLPIRAFTSADGRLEDGAVTPILKDPIGYRWCVPSDGLSRFDGQSFRTYGASEGLSGVSHMIEADGVYWIALNKGVARYDPHQPE